MAVGTAVKGVLRAAGTNLNSFLKQYADDALRLSGKLGQDAATAALQFGVNKFAPGMAGKTGKEIPSILRTGPRSTIPTVGRMLGQAALGGSVLYGASLLDQQSDHSQPMPKSTGDSNMDKFLMDQELQRQKFEQEMALIQNRAESRTPGSQFGGLRDAALAEREMSEAGEVTNKEVLTVARSLYGTGFRA
tara:strand:+ start:203 stop:775 length:573 start_codon:yes stop_codon:yes gene_type:complete